MSNGASSKTVMDRKTETSRQGPNSQGQAALANYAVR